MLEAVSELLVHHPFITSTLAGTLTLVAILRRISHTALRTKRLSPTAERVLIVGATSGVGRKLATLYAKRGAKVCIIGRRQGLLNEVKEECIQAGVAAGANPAFLAKAADMTSPEDLVSIRDYLEKGEIHSDRIEISTHAMKRVGGCRYDSHLRWSLSIASSYGRRKFSTRKCIYVC
jgi:short chain dehydrogenase